ncbi:MAG: hypothetical protein ACYC2H_11360 [Thermoplasmatota archaeon]
MLRAAPVVLLVAFVAAVLPSAAAQAHQHGGFSSEIAIAHDGPPDGRTFVGNVNHFSVIAHGDDEIPDFHQDIPWRVRLNGAILVETTSDSGHDYDGVNTFDIVFPVEGEYMVEALDAEGKTAAMFMGTVGPAPASPGSIKLDLPSGPVVAGQLAKFTYSVSDAGEGGSDLPIAHSDCTFEALIGGRTEFRAKSHTHEDRQSLDYAFAQAGTYTIRVLCFQAYPSMKATLFAPVVLEQSLMVLPGPPANNGAAPPGFPPPPAALNAVVTAPAGDGMTLVGTFDPFTVVGPDTLQHLNVLAVNTTGNPIQHVDFTAVLDGPAGQVFASDSLHEYDGILEFTTRQLVPGPYTLRVTAEGASGSGELAMTYVVAPRAAPTNAGLVDVTLDAPDVSAGAASPWTLAAAATSGPFAHGELDIRLTASGSEIPYLQTKLHTHADGRFPLMLALPTAEAYALEVQPFPLMAELVLPEPASFTIEPVGGMPMTGVSAMDGPTAGQEAPAIGPVLVLVALVALAVARRP